MADLLVRRKTLSISFIGRGLAGLEGFAPPPGLCRLTLPGPSASLKDRTPAK